MKKVIILLNLSFLLSMISCKLITEKRQVIDLQGVWQFEADPDNRLVGSEIRKVIFTDSILLPGTTDTNQKGSRNAEDSETSRLSRRYEYQGKAWYRKEVTIPYNWSGKSVFLTLERTKPTHLWVDSTFVGMNNRISSSQVYDLSTYLTPGTHILTILVDNGESVPAQIITNSHAYTSSTQTNWNGIIGRLFLEAREPIHIQDVTLTPDVTNRSVLVRFSVANASSMPRGLCAEVQATSFNSPEKHQVKPRIIALDPSLATYEFEYALGDDALLWSEHTPALYHLELSLCGYDQVDCRFGLRSFRSHISQFRINGENTFLRGKHDACVFPLTAHVPMDLESWRTYFRTCKAYGINHCRFHSWCPPAACFEAADLEGIYLQPELPFWGALKREDAGLIRFLKEEGEGILREYGNAASFVMFALGNELSGEQDLMAEFINGFRILDSRPLYAYGSNNFLGYSGQIPGEDFLVTCRIGGADDYSTHTRASFSFADAEQGGYLNNTYPNTRMDFDGALTRSSIPVISHETGQFQSYPDFAEIEKYTGVLRPDNLLTFRDRLEKAGMMGQARDFSRASGRWASLLYKADIEMCLRSAKMAGFQLLDLQDYPGQGSAYVGILDAFMDNKGHMASSEWTTFCNDVVPLLICDKYCWSTDEKLTGTIKLANYSGRVLKDHRLCWSLRCSNGDLYDNGTLTVSQDKQGLLTLGDFSADLSTVSKPMKMEFELALKDTPYQNRYSIWVYPAEEKSVATDPLIVCDRVDSQLTRLLKGGKTVLLFPSRERYRSQTVGGLFQTDYWNYRMFRGICESAGKEVSPGTLGILTDPEHPLLSRFPSDYHTDWQWYPIIKQSYPFILDALPQGYKPIVQVIDNIERNHRLGLVFEFRVEQGRLLVCMADLSADAGKPEMTRFHNALLEYAGSDQFQPQQNLSADDLISLFEGDYQKGRITGVHNISYED